MSKYWSGLMVAFAMSAAVGLAAQEARNPSTQALEPAAAPADEQRTQSPAPRAAETAQNKVVVSGCVNSAPSIAAAPDPAAPGAGAPTTMASFVLANPRITSGGRTATAGAVGTAGVESTTSYSLQGDDKLLSPHLNHQVEITGTLHSSAASTTGAERAAPGSTAAGATLRVESVKMVAAMCEPADPTTTPRQPVTEPARPAQPAQPADPARPERPSQPEPQGR